MFSRHHPFTLSTSHLVLLCVVSLAGVAHQQGTGKLAATFHSSVQAAVAAANKPGIGVQVLTTVSAAGGECHSHPASAATAAAACSVDWPSVITHPGSSSSTDGALQHWQELDGWLQQQLHAASGSSGVHEAAGHYRLILLPSVAGKPSAAAATGADDPPKHPMLIVGRHRHAWVTYDPSWAEGSDLQELQKLAAAAAVSVLSCCFAMHAGPAGLQAAASLPISAAGRSHLSLSLVNADPDVGSCHTWDMNMWEAEYLTPVIASLAPVTSVTVESQVLMYSTARLQGTWSDKHSAYVVKGSQLPFFIDSEWSIEAGRAVTPPERVMPYGSSHAAPSGAAAAQAQETASLVQPHVLQFLLYVPQLQHRPLQLLGRKGRVRDSNSYVIPSWGGLLVLNPDTPTNSTDPASSSNDNSSSEDQEAGSSSGDACRTQHVRQGGPVELSPKQYQHMAAVIIAQLQALFGVAPSEGDTSSDASGLRVRVQPLPAGRLGFSAWQVDALLRQRSAHDVREASRVLAALSTLVQELPNLEMPDLIGEQVGA